MKKRNKLGAKSWLKSIKEDVLPGASKFQPYEPTFIPYALKNRKKFYNDSKGHSFKTQGGRNVLLLARAREAAKTGLYPDE